MNYSVESVLKATKQAAKNISDIQPAVWSLPEVSICHHIANELSKLFPDFDVDMELIKDNRRRPDIAIHGRGHNENNLAIYQVKKNPTTHQLEEDLFKIWDTFFREPYNYRYGILVSVGKLPEILPAFDKNRVGILEVYGWAKMTDEEFFERNNI